MAYKVTCSHVDILNSCGVSEESELKVIHSAVASSVMEGLIAMMFLVVVLGAGESHMLVLSHRNIHTVRVQIL